MIDKRDIPCHNIRMKKHRITLYLPNRRIFDYDDLLAAMMPDDNRRGVRQDFVGEAVAALWSHLGMDGDYPGTADAVVALALRYATTKAAVVATAIAFYGGIISNNDCGSPKNS